MIRLALVPALFVLAACEPYPAASSVAASRPAPSTVAAEPRGEVPKEELCSTTREVAERVMRARQVGIPQEQVLARVQVVSHAGLRRLSEVLTRSAYSQPIHASENAQDRAVAAFASQQEATCHSRRLAAR